MHLVMICGQGNSGKSTFCKYLQNINPNIIHISIDNIVKEISYNKDIHFPIYISEIQKCINQSKENTVIFLDFSHDSISAREHVLDRLNFNNLNINFYTVSLRPGIENICSWQENRNN